MSIRFTRLRSNVCWAKPNHGFFYCQHFRAIFFPPARAPRPPHAAPAALPPPPIAAADIARKTAHAKKAGKFPCFLQQRNAGIALRAGIDDASTATAAARASLSAS
ncbi:hypothetical protein [Xanthomonas sp. NCPPB 1128]|uniref:hypothetical protein n=1 Tax=Xanthomonas sp. NCPPB 1128 TaxID=1775876 RepID=UPI0010396A14|nr:hypothetical protein [Xanthomonas sp. NCPPB 1128]